MFTSRSFLVLYAIIFLHVLVEARPQEVVTSVAVVTVYADGNGEGAGAPVSTVAATDGVDQPAGDAIIVPFVADGGVVMAATSTIPAMITPPPDVAGAEGGVSPATPSNPDCNRCSIYFQYVSAYYWPTPNTNNTACLAGVTEEVNGPVPTDLVPQYPSNYLVFPTISAGNACTRVGNIYYDQTIAFAPGAVSSIVGQNPPVTKEFNFADLPCPPPDVAAEDIYFYNPSYNPGRPYSPMIAPPQEIFGLDPAFAECVVAVYQGFDPPKAFPPYVGPGGPGSGGWKGKRSAPGRVPRSPAKTAAAGWV